MARTNLCKPDRMAGDDFTKYPLGAFIGRGPYAGPLDADFLTTPVGTFTIVAGLEVTGKNVLKAAFRNPSLSASHTQQCWTMLDPTVKVPNALTGVLAPLPYANVPQWCRIRFRFPPTCFSTTAVPVFGGVKTIFLFYAASAQYNTNAKQQLYDISLTAKQNLATGLFQIEVNTTQADSSLGVSDPNNDYFTADVLPANFYQDDQWHELIVYWNGVGQNLIWKLWVDSNPIPVLSIVDTYQYPRTGTFPMYPRDSFIWNRFFIASQTVGQASIPAQDFYYISMWEMLDATKYPNPYNVVIDPVTLVFDTYETVTSTYQFYDSIGFPVTLAFILAAGQTPPQCKFVDYSFAHLDVIPRIQGGDWVDITTDGGSLVSRFRYGDNGEAQTFTIDLRRGNIQKLIIARNKSNPVIHTSGGNTHSLGQDRKNKDLNPLGYLVGNNRPTTTLTEGEKRRTR